MASRIIQCLALVFSLCLMACAATHVTSGSITHDASSPTIQFLKGQMLTTSPDGETPYGPPVDVIARRAIDAAKGLIVEDSWHGGEHHRTTMTLRAGTSIFDAHDDKKTFEGTLTFEDSDWLRGGVTYDIALSDQSGTITGTGDWEGDTYRTTKVFSDPTGVQRAKMSETLTLITEAEFDAARAK